MITKKSIYAFFYNQNHLISNVAGLLTILSIISFMGMPFAENLDWIWPFVALMATTSSILMAISLRKAKIELAEINQAFDTLFSRHCDMFSERVATDVKDNPELFTRASVAAMLGSLRYTAKNPEEIDKLIERLIEEERHKPNK